MVADQIAARGVADPRVLAAMREVPREAFVPAAMRRHAYDDNPVPLGHGQTVSQPYVVAAMTELAAIGPDDRVLEIGTGSGYTAAVMATLGARVVTLERFRTLSGEAQARLERLGIPVAVRLADGCKGLHTEGPYDRVIAWAAFDQLPRFLGEQVASNGIVVAPMGPGDGPQSVLRLTKVGSRFEREDIGTARFQPLVAGIAAAI